MRALMRSTLKSLAQFFQILLESPGSYFHLFESRSLLLDSLAEFVIYKRSFLNTEAVCCDIFESFSFAVAEK